jgi:hypothetical protein
LPVVAHFLSLSVVQTREGYAAVLTRRIINSVFKRGFS